MRPQKGYRTSAPLALQTRMQLALAPSIAPMNRWTSRFCVHSRCRTGYAQVKYCRLPRIFIFLALPRPFLIASGRFAREICVDNTGGASDPSKNQVSLPANVPYRSAATLREFRRCCRLPVMSRGELQLDPLFHLKINSGIPNMLIPSPRT